MSERLTWPAYLEHIRVESARFGEVMAHCDPAAQVPSCQDWTARDLLRHLAGVQHWWWNVMDVRPALPEAYVEPPLPTDYGDLLAFFAEWSGRFQELIGTIDPAEPAYSWSSKPEDHTVGFTYRRQAHEALIHRLDAELTAGTVTDLPADLAADGVAETLDVMLGGLPPWGSWAPSEHWVRLDLIDVDVSVWSQLGVFSGTDPEGVEYAGEEDQHLVSDPGVEPDVVVQGTADDVDAWLWRRRDDSGITVTGDLDLYARWRIAVNHSIN
ncbi:maleylpyruvate isomerase family mycothiol-dependent enzyme [soil metagenome]